MHKTISKIAAIILKPTFTLHNYFGTIPKNRIESVFFRKNLVVYILSINIHSFKLSYYNEYKSYLGMANSYMTNMKLE